MVGAVECGCDGGGIVFLSNLDFMVNVTNKQCVDLAYTCSFSCRKLTSHKTVGLTYMCSSCGHWMGCFISTGILFYTKHH